MIDNQIGYKGEFVNIIEADFDRLVIDPDLDLSEIVLMQCIIGTVELSRSSITDEVRNSLHFHDCMIDRLEGAISVIDVPAGVLTGTTSVETYAASSATNDAVMNSTLPDPVKVLLTVLRKLFMQRGTGRQYGALKRGIPSKLLKYVDPVTEYVKSCSFAEDVILNRRKILIPNRSVTIDFFSIINCPNTSDHTLIEKVWLL